MSTDPKIDLFSKELFTTLWRMYGFWRIPPKPKPFRSELNEDILKGVMVRQAMFHQTYLEIFENTHAEFAGNVSYFFDTIVIAFPHRHKKLGVMSQLLCSVAFVAEMCMWCTSEGDDFLPVAHKAWAMFVDMELKDSFYDAGGWEWLKLFAIEQLAVFNYVRVFSELVDGDMGKNVLAHESCLTVAAIDSFQGFVDWTEDRHGHDGPFALAWVDYCVEEPPMEFISARFYNNAHPITFMKLQEAIHCLGRILLCYPDDYYETTERLVCSPNEDDGESGIRSNHLEIDHASSLATIPIADNKIDEYVSGSIAEELGAGAYCHEDDDSDATERLGCSPNKDDGESGIVSHHSDIEHASSSLSTIPKAEHKIDEYVSGSICPEDDDDSDATERLGCSPNKDDGKSGIQSNHSDIEYASSSFPTIPIAENKIYEHVTESIAEEFGAKDYYPEDDPHATERLGCFPSLDDEESRILLVHPEIDNAQSSPTSPTVYIDADQGRVEYISKMKAKKLRATDPENVFHTSRVNPVHIVGLVTADKTSNIEGEEDKDNECRNSVIIDEGNKMKCSIEIDNKKRESKVSNSEKEVVFKQLLSAFEQSGLSVLEIKPEGEYISDKNVLPDVSSSGLESKGETDRNLKEILCSSSFGVIMLDPADLCKEKGSDDSQSQMKTNSSDIELLMGQLGLQKVSDHVSTDLNSKVHAYLKTIDSENIVPDDSIQETCKRKSVTPRELPFRNVNVSNVADGKSMNSSSSKGRKEKSYVGKENLPPRDSKAKTKVTNQSKSSRTNLKSSVEAKGRKSEENSVGKHSLNQVEGSTVPYYDADTDDELLSLAKRSMKTCGQTKQLESGTEPNDLVNLLENSISGNQEVSEQTIRKFQTDHFVGHRLEDDVEPPSTHGEIPGSMKASHQNSVLTDCDENSPFSEKSPKTFDSEVIKNDPSTRPCMKDEYEGLSRQVSQDSASTEIYQLETDDISLAEPTTGDHPLRFALEVDDEPGIPFETRLDTVEPSRNAEKESPNRNDSTGDPLQTTEREAASPQDAEKKGKKKKSKKRLSRLDVRVKEDGNAIQDVMKLILVMGHRPGMEYVVSTFQRSKEEELDCNDE